MIEQFHDPIEAWESWKHLFLTIFMFRLKRKDGSSTNKTGIVMVTLALILQTVTKRFLFKRKTLLVCFQETYDRRITLRKTVRAMKREDYHITAILVNLMQAASVTPSALSARCVSPQQANTRNSTPSWNYFDLLPEHWFVSIMLVSVTSEVGWIEIHVARITRPTIRHKTE